MLKNCISYIKQALNKNLEISEYCVVALGFIGIVGHPLYWAWWSYVDPKPEIAWLRIFGIITCGGLLFIKHFPAPLKKYTALYWFLTATFNLPFFFTIYLLNSHFSMIWSMAEVIAFFLIIMLFYKIMLIVFSLAIGVGLGILYFILTNGSIEMEMDRNLILFVYLPIFNFVIISGAAINYTYYLGIINREKKIATEAIEILLIQKLAAQSHKFFTSLSGSLSHELRNPLASIRGGLGLVRINLESVMEKAESDNDSQIKTDDAAITIPLKSLKESLEYIELCDDSVDQGNMIIDLTLEKIHDKPIDRNKFFPISILATIDQAMKQYAFVEGQSKKIIINIHPENDFIYLGIKDVMLFVLFNLIKNSLYYIGTKAEGKIIISISKNDDWNYLHLKDNGPGISKERIATIFNNFMTHDKISGTGLGLPFCKRVMNDFDGTIECISEVGVGTEFILGFPKYSR